MKAVMMLVIALVLTGCAEFNATKAGIASHSAEASDSALDTALWTMCKASPVGAVKRRFKTDAEVAAYNTLCPTERLP